MENPNIKIEEFKRGMLSDNWDTILKSGDSLVKIGNEEVFKFLINLLESENVLIRNGAALALHDLENSEAVEPLLKSIFRPENKNHNGTMVYALENLNCENRLVDIFKILFYHEDEPKMSAYTILEEQIFKFNRDDLKEIEKMWNECSLNPEKGKGFDNKETKLMMMSAYKGFIEYLNE